MPNVRIALLFLVLILILPVGISYGQPGTNATARFGLYDGEAVSVIALTNIYDLGKWAQIEQKVDDGFDIRDIVMSQDKIFVILEEE